MCLMLTRQSSFHTHIVVSIVQHRQLYTRFSNKCRGYLRNDNNLVWYCTSSGVHSTVTVTLSVPNSSEVLTIIGTDSEGPRKCKHVEEPCNHNNLILCSIVLQSLMLLNFITGWRNPFWKLVQSPMISGGICTQYKYALNSSHGPIQVTLWFMQIRVDLNWLWLCTIKIYMWQSQVENVHYFCHMLTTFFFLTLQCYNCQLVSQKAQIWLSVTTIYLLNVYQIRAWNCKVYQQQI